MLDFLLSVAKSLRYQGPQLSTKLSEEPRILLNLVEGVFLSHGCYEIMVRATQV
jgi:hypothetical protein